jgi:formylglycine-generating enzyme required for sulfatase activity
LGYLSQNSTALHEAGLKRPNGFGLLDTLGDVVEWVNDWFDEHYYQSSPAQDPQGPSSGKVRVQRGGSYLDLPAGVRVSARSAWNPTVRFATNGFRCSAGEKDLIEAVAATPRQQPSVEAKVQNAPPPGQVQVNPKDGAKYVWISPGTFMMGCSPGDSECGAQEMPAHQVTISGGFWMGQTLVTAEAYQRFAGATGRKMPKAPHFNQNWTDGQMPIVNANWDDAHDYCAWAGGRLPTEAEWEYAARGGSTEARTGPIDEIAWYNQNSEKQPHDVARKRANGFGLFDMLGNVWEWVNDWYDASYYLYTPAQDPPGAEQNPGVRGATFQPWARSLRGGSWQQHALWIRVSARDSFTPAHGYDNIGFRCAREVVSP